MVNRWTGWLLLLLGGGVLAPLPGLAVEENGVPEAGGAKPLLTLSLPLLRSTMEQANMGWAFPSRLPDMRLKVEQPEWSSLTTGEVQSRLRGVEFRLPMEGLWVGYESQAGEENPRATISIQLGF